MILAIDPGKNKCGLAVLDKAGKILEKSILARQEVAGQIPAYLTKFGISILVVGKSSFGKELEKELSRLDLNASLVFISEKYSTLEARQRYWEENPPRGLWKLIPLSLRVPPRAVDDYAAVILGERYLKE